MTAAPKLPKTISHAEFRAELKMQGMVDRLDYAFVCPACGTIQSARSLIAAGAGKTFEDVERRVGFSCVGRWTHAEPPPQKPLRSIAGRGCNWTLGGLLKIHQLQVIAKDGNSTYPLFEIALPWEAQDLRDYMMAEAEAAS